MVFVGGVTVFGPVYYKFYVNIHLSIILYLSVMTLSFPSLWCGLPGFILSILSRVQPHLWPVLDQPVRLPPELCPGRHPPVSERRSERGHLLPGPHATVPQCGGLLLPQQCCRGEQQGHSRCQERPWQALPQEEEPEVQGKEARR